MARKFVKRYSDHLVRSICPKNKGVDPNVVLDDAFGATSSFKVYDINRDEALYADESSGQTVLSVTNAGTFSNADDVEITLDNGSFHIDTILQIDTVNETVTIGAPGLPSAASIGNRVRKIFGTSISMAEYGTPNIDSRLWGFQENLPDDHVVYDDSRAKAGLDADIEIRFNGGPGLAMFDVLCITIQEDDCV